MSERALWTRVVGPDLQVEVDGTGNIQVAVRAHERTDRDGYARSDVSNADEVYAAMQAARRFIAAVFTQGTGDNWGTTAERTGAYDALAAAGKLAGHGQNRLAGVITDFMRDWEYRRGQDRDKTMEEYAKEWERWW